MGILSRFKKYILALLDVCMIAVAYGGTYVFLEQVPAFGIVSITLYISVVTYLLIFLAFGIYHNMVLYSSVREYALCFFSCLLSALLVCLESRWLSYPIPGQQIMLAGVFAGILCVGVRVAARIFLKFSVPPWRRKQDVNRLLIIGAGEAGNLVIKELASTNTHRYEIVGLIDDDKGKIGCRLSGVKILGNRDAICQVCREKKVDTILFAIPSSSGKTRKEFLDICAQTGCQLQTLPNISEIVSGKSMVTHMRSVNICDLLNRDPVSLNNVAIGDLIQNRVVLVTGGGGSIGSELCRQIARYGPAQLLILDIYENNAYDIQQELKDRHPELNQRVIIASVRDQKRLEEVFAAYRPALVFHAAAHKHVPLMEDDPKEAVKNNIFGTLNVAKCADQYHAEKFVLISTDKAVNPTNIMGATKRACEMVIQSLDRQSQTEYAAVRFGNVLGSNGSVVPLFQRQIAAGGPVTVTHKEITRFFMTIPEAAQLVLQAAADAAGGEIFVLDMGEPVKIYDLAENLIKLSGLKPGRDIEIKLVGLRPGEKLYEELMMEEEGLKATQSKKIFIAKSLETEPAVMQGYLDSLQQAVSQEGNAAVIQSLARMVTTYRADSRCDYEGAPAETAAQPSA